MKRLTYLAIENDDLAELARALPVDALSLADLLPRVRQAADKADVVEVLRPDARRHLKHAYLGIHKA
jgi:hypothetical protein